jgi:uncharacterized protein (DUF1684 family)
MEIEHDVLQETMQLQSAQGSPASLPTVTEVEHMLQYAKQRLEVAMGVGTGSPIIMGTHGEFWRKHETTQATV